MTVILLALTLIRALSLLGAPILWLVSIIAAWRTPALFDAGWFLLACASAALYVLATLAFTTLGNRYIRRSYWKELDPWRTQ